MIIFELVYKAISRSKPFNIIFIINFSLAILSLSFLQFFKGSIETSLSSKSKNLLGADIVVSSRFPITDKQKETIIKRLPNVDKSVEGISTVSMITSKDRSRLMEVVKTNLDYPYYGGLIFNDDSVYPAKGLTQKSNEVWVYKEVLELLSLNLGDNLKIGKEQFLITKVIKKDSLKSVSFSGFIPKVYISQEALDKTQLLQFGSTARYNLNYKLKENLTNDQLEEIENKLEEGLDQNLRVLSPNDGRDRLVRILSLITNFLSLVSLVSFFLGLIGLIYLYTGFLRKHQKDIDILNDLGFSKRNITLTYLLHLLSLITISSILTFLIISLSGPFLAPLIKSLIDFDFNFNLNYLFFLKSAVVLLILSLSIGLPLILPLTKKDEESAVKKIGNFTPFILFLLLISHFVMPVKGAGLLFTLSILVLIFIFFIFGKFILNKLDFSGHLQSLAWSLALKNIVRQKKTSLTLFIAILLCTSLFSIIPQIGSSLGTALNLSADNRPRFFVIDAKEEQIDELNAEVLKVGGRLENISPMIRARIIKVNDIDFRDHSSEFGDKELKEERNELKNRAVNLSYRSKLKDSEKLLEGRDFSGKYVSEDFSKPVEVSVEKRYANRRGLKLGDKLIFDILGLELNAVIINIRTVKWTDFVPNFFLILQDGAINDAPKKILATISSGKYNAQELILNLANKFPSLTVVDVKSLFEEFAELVKSIVLITDRMSFFSIIIGLFMSFIIIQYQMNLQKNNILRLKMIGINNKTIKNSFLIEFGLISFSASVIGIFLGSIGSFAVSSLLFESYHELRLDLLLIYSLFIPILTLLVVSFFTSQMIHKRENLLFSE